MGLTVHFHIGLPATTPRDDVVERVSRLRSAAELLPFAAVGPLVATPEDPSLGPESPLEGLVRWWTWLQTDQAGPATAGSGLPDAIAFGVDVGDQCEPATFGVAWLHPRDEEFRALRHEPAAWRWLCSCKTQYASNVSEDHFLQCHMAIIALLDEAVRLGFEVEVGDEGNYWDTRDVEQLRRHVQDTSHIIARFAGALHDAVGQEHKVESPIFERKDFERLEMDRRGTCHLKEPKMLSLSLDQIVDLLDQHGQRATYGAVARIVGHSPRSLLKGRERARRYSWIVNRETGLPTGYPDELIDPRVRESGPVIGDDAELRRWLETCAAGAGA